MPLDDFVGDLVAGIVEAVATIGEWFGGPRRPPKPFRSGTPECPTPRDVIARTLEQLLERRLDNGAEFVITGAQEPWVRVRLEEAEYVVHLHYPFTEKPAVEFARRGVRLPPWTLDFFEPGHAVVCRVSTPVQRDVEQLVHGLFKQLHGLGDTYSLTGRLRSESAS